MTEKLVEHQRALLLLHLLGAKDRRLTLGEANKKLTQAAKKFLGLNNQMARQLRETMTQEGLLKKAEGRAVIYELTDKGVATLVEMEQYPTIAVTGRDMNALAGAITELSASWTGPDSKPILEAFHQESQTLFEKFQDGLSELVSTVRRKLSTPQHRQASLSESVSEMDQATWPSGTTPREPQEQAPRSPDHLAEAIVSAFQELLRERYSHTAQVPVHEVRRWIADTIGPEAARHQVFDPQVQLLRQQQRLRLVAISDLRKATPEQLNDSLPGVNETLFYLEPAHEPALR